jgi:hypothetical protein
MGHPDGAWAARQKRVRVGPPIHLQVRTGFVRMGHPSGSSIRGGGSTHDTEILGVEHLARTVDLPFHKVDQYFPFSAV